MEVQVYWYQYEVTVFQTGFTSTQKVKSKLGRIAKAALIYLDTWVHCPTVSSMTAPRAVDEMNSTSTVVKIDCSGHGTRRRLTAANEITYLKHGYSNQQDYCHEQE